MLLYVEKRFVFKRFFLSGVLINSQFYKNETYFVCGFLEWFNFSSFLRLKLLLILRKNSLYLMIMMCWLKYSSSKKLFCILKGAKTQIILLIPKSWGINFVDKMCSNDCCSIDYTEKLPYLLKIFKDCCGLLNNTFFWSTSSRRTSW